MKKNSLTIAILLVVFVNALAQTKVLFLGNSFTKYTQNIPAMFSSMASAAGISVTVDYRTQGGMAVANEQITGHINDATSQNKINAQNWDYIVVQDNLGNYAGSVGNINSNCYNGNVTLYNQIKTNYNCTRIIYFAGWGPNGGTSSGDNTAACINRIHSNMILLNNAIADEIVTPIGKSWITSMTQLPSENLYSADNLHPSLEGAYLAMVTIFTTIFKTDLTNVSYDGGLNSTSAQTMRTIAFNTVTNSVIYPASHLNAFTPVITVNGATLTCSGNYSSYQWYNNGNPLGTNSNTYIATSNGKHKVIVTDSAGCAMSSFEVNLTTVDVETINPNNLLTLTPVSSNVFKIISKIPGIISIYDMQGKLIYLNDIITDNLQIDLNNITKGIYIISFQSTTIKTYQKMNVY